MRAQGSRDFWVHWDVAGVRCSDFNPGPVGRGWVADAVTIQISSDLIRLWGRDAVADMERLDDTISIKQALPNRLGDGAMPTSRFKQRHSRQSR